MPEVVWKRWVAAPARGDRLILSTNNIFHPECDNSYDAADHLDSSTSFPIQFFPIHDYSLEQELFFVQGYNNKLTLSIINISLDHSSKYFVEYYPCLRFLFRRNAAFPDGFSSQPPHQPKAASSKSFPIPSIIMRGLR